MPLWDAGFFAAQGPSLSQGTASGPAWCALTLGTEAGVQPRDWLAPAGLAPRSVPLAARYFQEQVRRSQGTLLPLYPGDPEAGNSEPLRTHFGAISFNMT